MKITDSVIKEIEKALSIELFQHQKDYLINNTPMHTSRHNGKTLAHCIKLALSEGIPLNIDLPELFCDDDYGPERNRINCARSYYRYMFQEVWEKLKSAGFPVREVVFRPKEGTTYEK
jgi:hypothetical protein